MKDDSVYLKHILEAIRHIDDYVKGLDFALFNNDEKTIDAVVRKLEIIGEAANNLSDEFKNNHSEIPFSDMIDMRNMLIHEYFGVNQKIVWNTCKEDLPRLKKVIEDFLR